MCKLLCQFFLLSSKICGIMLIGDFMRIYEFCTQWLTLTVLFFIIDYHTEWLEVVTLGGLVAGSGLIGLWTTLLDRLATSCSACLRSASTRAPYYHPHTSPWPEIFHKAIVLLGVFIGVVALSRILPGYTLKLNGVLTSFLFTYGLVATYIGKLLQKSH